MFTVYSENGTGTTLVSNIFIDNYMRDANDAQLKVYLYLLRMMNAGRSTSISDMADQFNHTEKEVMRSLRYWESRGLIVLEYDGAGSLSSLHMVSPGPARAENRAYPVPFDSAGSAASQHGYGQAGSAPSQYGQTGSSTSQYGQAGSALPQYGQAVSAASQYEEAGSASIMKEAPSREMPADSVSRSDTPSLPLLGRMAIPAQHSAAAAADDPPAKALPSPKQRPDAADLEAFRSSQKRAQLLFVIEQYIGKPLSPSEVETVYFISEQLHFSDSLIDYLLQYCIDRNKKDFRYIEKVAINWAEHGITTSKQAERAVSGFGKNRRGSGAGTRPVANPFNQFEQNQYDFDQLEKELLSN